VQESTELIIISGRSNTTGLLATKYPLATYHSNSIQSIISVANCPRTLYKNYLNRDTGQLSLSTMGLNSRAYHS
jgi:hypothetical protein